MSFEEFQKIPRLSRGCVITEKIDGTNAQILIDTADVPRVTVGYTSEVPWIAEVGNLKFAAGSRNRYITPEKDNFGFARWVQDNAVELRGLGSGRHFGEWWGSGVQRGYGLTKGEKRFSLFNVARWADDRDREKYHGARPACCHVVPVLYAGPFTTVAVEEQIDALRIAGSAAAPGFSKPEGVVIWHVAAGVLFKKTLEKDEAPKSAA